MATRRIKSCNLNISVWWNTEHGGNKIGVLMFLLGIGLIKLTENFLYLKQLFTFNNIPLLEKLLLSFFAGNPVVNVWYPLHLLVYILARLQQVEIEQKLWNFFQHQFVPLYPPNKRYCKIEDVVYEMNFHKQFPVRYFLFSTLMLLKRQEQQ